MDHKDENQNVNLDQLIKDFKDVQLKEDITAEIPAPPLLPAEPAAADAATPAAVDAPEIPQPEKSEAANNNEPAPAADDLDITRQFEKISSEADSLDADALLEELGDTSDILSDTLVFGEENGSQEDTPGGDTITFENSDKKPQQKAPSAPIPLSRSEKLKELKKKLVAGPEKRYYDLNEKGLGKLQISILLNLVIFALCLVALYFYSQGMVREHRMKLMVFSQVIAMLVSGLLGASLLMDGFGDLFRFRYSMNTSLIVAFLACCADAVFCLEEQRLPCCAGFVLEMTFALFAQYHRRSTEMAQMDTMRKAIRLTSLVKEPNYYKNYSAILRGPGDVDDFMDTYNRPSAPGIIQSVYAFVALMASIGIAVLAGLLHRDISAAVQFFSVSMLVTLPASYFVSLTRPAAVLQKRLHMVGTVICGWQGVKKLSSKAVFPLRDKDLFPHGSTKLNGIKFYSERTPDVVVSYTSSLILEAGGGLVPLFRNLLVSRSGTEYPVENFRDYGVGGIGGEVCGESVLLGSLEFLQSMGVEIPQGTTVSQAIYVAIDGEFSAVIAISYSKMRSAAAGLISICGTRKLRPLLLAGDFMLTDNFIRNKFSIRCRRMIYPDWETRSELATKRADPEADVLALVTRDDLIASAYAVTGAMALRTACKIGTWIHIFAGIVGLVIMLSLAYLGYPEYLTPYNVLLYQAVWMIPGFFASEWTRSV